MHPTGYRSAHRPTLSLRGCLVLQQHGWSRGSRLVDHAVEDVAGAVIGRGREERVGAVHGDRAQRAAVVAQRAVRLVRQVQVVPGQPLVLCAPQLTSDTCKQCPTSGSLQLVCLIVLGECAGALLTHDASRHPCRCMKGMQRQLPPSELARPGTVRCYSSALCMRSPNSNASSSGTRPDCGHTTGHTCSTAAPLQPAGAGRAPRCRQ